MKLFEDVRSVICLCCALSDGEEGRANNAKIKVQIKPFNLLDMPVPTNSTEDLKKFAGALRLSPTTTVSISTMRNYITALYFLAMRNM